MQTENPSEQVARLFGTPLPADWPHRALFSAQEITSIGDLAVCHAADIEHMAQAQGLPGEDILAAVQGLLASHDVTLGLIPWLEADVYGMEGGLSPRQMHLQERIEELLQSPDQEVVLQGCALLQALADPMLLCTLCDPFASGDLSILGRLRHMVSEELTGVVAVHLMLAAARLGWSLDATLSLRRVPHIPLCLRVLCSARAAREISALDLGGCGLTDADVADIVAAPNLSGLRGLVLDRNALGPVGARALANAAPLTRLDLRLNPIGEDGAAALAARSWDGLELYLPDVGLPGARLLAESPALSWLKRQRWQARIESHLRYPEPP